MLTSLGEEGAESLIWLSGLALFSEVSIRLHEKSVSVGCSRSLLNVSWKGPECIPEYRAQGSRAVKFDISI